jgi:hypothetical protein
MKNKYNLSDVIKSLRKKHDIKIFEHKMKICILSSFKVINLKGELKQIINPEKRFDIGNKSLGKIDYLVNYCHFHIFYILNF